MAIFSRLRRATILSYSWKLLQLNPNDLYLGLKRAEGARKKSRFWLSIKGIWVPKCAEGPRKIDFLGLGNADIKGICAPKARENFANFGQNPDIWAFDPRNPPPT